MESDIPVALRDHKHVIVQSPTGSGKSHVINKTVKRIMAAGKTALVLSDSRTIHGQLVNECSAWPIVSSIKFIHLLPAQCYVAMTQTLVRRTPIIEQFKALGDQLVIIVDEAHYNTMTPIVEEIKPKWLLGFTATPHWRWAKHIPKLYNFLIHGPQIKELQADGHLCHYRHVIRTGADLSKLEESSTGEYTESSQDRVFGGRRMYDGLFTDLPIYKGRKTIVYVASIKLCEELCQQFLLNGYKACRYHSGLDNGEIELKKFTETNECDICVSVSSLTRGWDYPPADLIVLWRATTSLVLYLQMCGRGARPCDTELALKEFNLSDYNKKQFTVLDYGGNFERFGAWNMDRDWHELWKPQRRKITTYAGVVGSKECPICRYLMNASAHVCPNCGYIYSIEEMRLVQGILVEVENSLNAIQARKISTFTPKELADYAKYKGKKQHAIRVAKSMEQSKPGYLEQFAKEMGYHHAWAERMIEQIPVGKKIDFYDSYVK